MSPAFCHPKAQIVANRSAHQAVIARSGEAQIDGLRRLGRRIPPGAYFPEGLLYTDSARYAAKVERYFEVFGRDHVCCILFDELVRDTPAVYRKTLEFLGVDPDFAAEFDREQALRRVRLQAIRELRELPPELRNAGLPVSLTENLDAMEAVRHIPLGDREAFKYALGATLYDLLTGKPPFHSGNIMMQVQNKVQLAVPRGAFARDRCRRRSPWPPAPSSAAAATGESVTPWIQDAPRSVGSSARDVGPLERRRHHVLPGLRGDRPGAADKPIAIAIQTSIPCATR